MISIEQLYSLFLSSNGVTTDSRNCKKDTIFFALKGDNFNGNLYAETALKQGCSFAIVDEETQSHSSNIFQVDDVLKTLQELAKHHRKQLNTPLLAITGTNGKTTTKELVYAVMSSSLKTIATEGNLNNHIGVPLTLLRLKEEHQFGIIEMGANHQDEIALLCEIAQPNMGLITNVGKAHLEGFGSFEGVKKAKRELYDFLKKTEGKIFLNEDNQDLLTMVGDSSFISYTTKTQKGSIQCVDYKVTPFLELTFKTIESENRYSIKSQLIGSYNLENILAAVTIGIRMHIDINRAVQAIENYSPSNNRSQLTKTTKNTLLIDCYNANPTSMAVALKNFKEIEHPSKMAILGEMREMGLNSIEEHTRLIAEIIAAEINDVFIVGDEFLKIDIMPSDFRLFATSDELYKFLMVLNPKDKMILIKGSRGNKLEKVLGAL